MKISVLGFFAAVVLLAGCSFSMGELPQGKAGVRLGLGASPRAVSDQKASITIQGVGPGSVTLDEQDVTDGDSLVILDPGHWTFTVLVKDLDGGILQEDSEEAELVAGETSVLTFTVHTRGQLTGRLLDEAGAPLVGATLWVANLSTSPATVATKALTTDVDGRFIAEDMPRGKLQVFVMDLAAGTSAPAAGHWWKPWLVGDDQTRVVGLDARGPEAASLYLWTQDPATASVAEVPMTLVETTTDNVREHVWSTTHNARAYFFTDPEPTLGTTFVFRSFHDRFDWGTEVNSNFPTAMWMRRDAGGWVTLAAGATVGSPVVPGDFFPGAPSKVVLHLRNTAGGPALTSGNAFPTVLSFSVTGPGLASATVISHDPSTGTLLFSGGTAGVYLFTATGGAEANFDPFSITIPKIGSLVDEDHSPETPFSGA